MSEIQYRKSSPEESDRWRAYLQRRALAVCESPPVRFGMRLAVLPAFGAQRCWTVEYGSAHREPVRAELAICDTSSDFDRFLAMPADAQAAMVPIVTRSAYDVDQPTLARIETLLGSASVPIVIRDPPRGTDGVSYRLEVRDAFNSMSLRWWHRGPRNWAAVPVCFQQVWAILNGLAGIIDVR